MKVLKFGGTSVGSAARMESVADLIIGKGRNIVVLSAMSGTTNTLVEISGYLYSHNQEGAYETMNRLKHKYVGEIGLLFRTDKYRNDALEYVNGVFGLLETIAKGYFTTVEEKIVLAQGELMSTYLMTCRIAEMGNNVKLLPALDFMRLDSNGEPDQCYIREKLLPLLEQDVDADLFITQGYICMNSRNEIDNLHRGGSDYSASLIGAAVGADEIQIWTDIDGLHNNDPRVVDNTVPVRHLNFDEAAELAYFGAKILHPTCIQPAKYANIPVRLLNTMQPDAPGTLIDNASTVGGIKAVAAKDNITAISIRSSRMLLAHGFLRRVFEIFESYKTSIDMICTSEVGVSMSIDNTTYLNEIVHDLKQYGTVAVDLDMCIVCVVGDMNWENLGFETKAMKALENIPVRMVSYGGSNCNISFLVREEDRNRALRSLSACIFD